MTDADEFRYYDLKGKIFKTEMEILNKQKEHWESLLKTLGEPVQEVRQKIDPDGMILAYYEHQMAPEPVKRGRKPKSGK